MRAVAADGTAAPAAASWTTGTIRPLVYLTPAGDGGSADVSVGGAVGVLGALDVDVIATVGPPDPRHSDVDEHRVEDSCLNSSSSEGRR